MAETQQLTVRLDLAGNFSTGITKAQGQLGGLAKSVGRVGKGVGQIGAGFARAGLLVGGAAVTGLTGAAKAAIDFEDAFAGVRKTVNEADLAKAGMSFEDLSTSFREMATEIPIAATEFARLGETAGALGVKVPDIEEFVRVTALMGVTTDLSADQAADAFGRIGTILNLTGDDYQELADSIVAVGNAGASVESEITEIVKRFAAQGKQAGLAKEEMVGLASATASLGFEPERGGTALARVFANMATNIALANSKGKQFAKTTGRSIADMQKALNRGEGLEIFLDFLGGIKDLSATDAAKVLKAAGVTNTSDRTIFQAMSDQLPFVNEQLELAENATGALMEEATKRFGTTASKIALFKNNIIEAGIAVGEQFLPAVRRSLDKVIGALKQPGTKGQLVQLGKDIGAAIDSIDWNAVIAGARDFTGVLKSTLSVTLEILKVLNALPTEIKAAAAAFLVLNKASGGLIGAGVGNVVGGVAGAAAQGALSRAPGVGKLFAQPVFVTNWPAGGLAGGTPAGGKGSALGTAAKGAAALTLVGIGGQAAAMIAGATRESDNRIINSQGNIARTVADSTQRLDIVNNSIRVLAERAATGDAVAQQQLIAQMGVRDRLMGVENSVSAGAAAQAALLGSQIAATAAGSQRQVSATSQGVAVQAALLGSQISTTMQSASATQGAVRSSAANNAAVISGAIRANRPIVTTIVNVTATQVTKHTTIQNRYGPSNGSRGQDHEHL